MKTAVIFVALFVVCAFSEHTKWHQLNEDYTFEVYMKEWGKKYEEPEIELRREKFTQNLARILEHNKKQSSFKMGVNHLTDYFDAELKGMHGYDKGMGRTRERKLAPPSPKQIVQALPKEVDWRGKGILTAVKDQGQCGSCWTFASAAQIETYTAMATNELPVLSEQQILDCANNSQQCGGTGGCEGGIAQLAYETMMKNGMASEWTYPYQSYFGQDFGQGGSDCRFDKSKMGTAATVKGYVDLESNNYNAVMSTLANIGPLAVNVDASQWHLYESGVFPCDMTTNIDINHVVQLVGYGTDDTSGDDYWLVRNSWSPAFGEEGFIRIYRFQNQTCGTDNTPLDGTGCVGTSPSSVTVCGSCGMIYDASYPKC
eukprot:CAMPEP_0201521620 /NCGR_PEP_ID=MMETSP0161_2-20130828/15226_1 /ASSEMBLY_ACC=CAM_ASM_000251 /TAXON_ID=180227 /ORGANISM="Neoparamoeba aestuarina, Strain SoJaBio B1-5/56/2" /LENGTH=371 /DNA_ID=CAMNT_0047920283 /DNA_START=32 /DNA_END=1147 /DNA_ORIENTATION=+